MSPANGIADLYEAASLYRNVLELQKKTHEPGEPISYRGLPYASGVNYVLLHEEEQHLADDLAFLAQTKSGPSSVSAVTLEQTVDPAGLIVRLAANKTPSIKAVEGLRGVLGIVSESARTGRNREAFRDRILESVIEMSKERILTRIQSNNKKKSWPPRSGNAGKPLYQRVGNLTTSTASFRPSGLEKASLIEQLVVLRLALEAVETSLPDHRVDTLKAAVMRCFAISQLNSQSFESYLQSHGIEKEIYESRTVAEIDKIARYYGLANDLVRFSRRRDCSSMFGNLTLEVLTAPPRSVPVGVSHSCMVHGEVQLVLYHSQFSSEARTGPRAIGSSKSTCFLCDLFVKKHGGFSVSGTHGRLYEQWRIPQHDWMGEKQAKMLKDVVREMNTVLGGLIVSGKRPGLRSPSGAESKAHIFLVPAGAVLLSPSVSAVSTLRESYIPHIARLGAKTIEEVVLGKEPALDMQDSAASHVQKEDLPIEIQTLSAISSIAGSLSTVILQKSMFIEDDLPLEIKVWPEMISCSLLIGKVNYTFDIRDLEHGTVSVSRSMGCNSTKLDVRATELEHNLVLLPTEDEGSLSVVVHDGGKNELLIVVSWI